MITFERGACFKTKKLIQFHSNLPHFAKISSMASSMPTENQQLIQGKNYRQRQQMIEDACEKLTCDKEKWKQID